MTKYKCKNCKINYRQKGSSFCKMCAVKSDYIETEVNNKDKDLYLECLEILSDIEIYNAKQKYKGIKLQD